MYQVSAHAIDVLHYTDRPVHTHVMLILLFSLLFADYPYCIRLSQKVDGKILVTFNARNEHDRCKFAEDLRESISEMDEMESLRIEAELERQKSARSSRNGGGSASSENRDSGMILSSCNQRAILCDFFKEKVF